MKKLIAILIAALMLLPLAACKKPGSADFKKDGYTDMFDAAIKLVTDFDRETLDKVQHPAEISYKISEFKKKDVDYIEALKDEFAGVAASYDEKYGPGWVITYTIDETVEKDEDGIEKYKAFDEFYFRTYGIDTDKFQAVTFVKLTVHISGPLGSGEKARTVQCFCIDGVWYSLYAIRLALKL